MDTRLIPTPRYYGQFSLSLGKESIYIFSKWPLCVRVNEVWLHILTCLIKISPILSSFLKKRYSWLNLLSGNTAIRRDCLLSRCVIYFVLKLPSNPVNTDTEGAIESVHINGVSGGVELRESGIEAESWIMNHSYKTCKNHESLF